MIAEQVAHNDSVGLDVYHEVSRAVAVAMVRVQVAEQHDSGANLQLELVIWHAVRGQFVEELWLECEPVALVLDTISAAENSGSTWHQLKHLSRTSTTSSNSRANRTANMHIGLQYTSNLFVDFSSSFVGRGQDSALSKVLGELSQLW